MPGANDTMPIRIPIGLNSTLDDDSARAIECFGRLRAAMRTTGADAALAGKSFAELQRNEEQLTATKQRMLKKLEDLRKAYAETDPKVEGNAERMTRMAQAISRTEKEIARLDSALEQVRLAEYAQEADRLAAEITELSQATEREVATLRIQGKESEAAQAAGQNAAKIKQLYAERVKALGAAIEKATAAEGANSKIVQELSARYNMAADSLTKLAGNADTARNSVGKLGGEAKQSVDEVIKGIGGIMSAQSGLGQVGNALTNGVTKPLIEAGHAALDAAVANQSMEQTFNAVFKSSAANMRSWSVAVSDSMDLSEYRLRNYASALKILFNGLELSGSGVNEMIRNLTLRGYDLAALYDSDVNTAFEKLRAGLTGSSEPLQQWGIIVKENQVKAYAWKKGIAENGRELTEQEKVLARYGLIMEQSAQSQGRWNAEAADASGKLKTNAERLDEINVKLGEQLVPFMTMVLDVIEPITNWLGQLNERGAKAILWIVGAMAILGPLIRLLGVIQQFQMAAKIGGVLTAGTALTNFLGGPFMITMAKVVLIAITLAAAIALVAAMIALANGNAAKYQQALNDANRVGDRVNSARNSARSISRNARGTRYFGGGETWVGEEGPEKVYLPQGTRIRPAGESRRGDRDGDDITLVVTLDQVKDVVNLIGTARDARRLARQQ